MPADIRDYLIERFRGDAETLRQRAAVLSAAKKPSPGPDAALSLAMAAACDDVVGLAEALPVGAPLNEIVRALQTMLPELQRRANGPSAAAAPAVRSVYAGACTRVQELITAETSAMVAGTDESDDAFIDEDFDEDFGEDLDADDPDADDDDLYEDDAK